MSQYLLPLWKKEWISCAAPEGKPKPIGGNYKEEGLWSKWEGPFLRAELCHHGAWLFSKEADHQHKGFSGGC